MSGTKTAIVLLQLDYDDEVGATVLNIWQPEGNDYMVTLQLTAEQAQLLYSGREVQLNVQEVAK